MRLATFIIPTRGNRATSERAIKSLIAQKDDDWTAVIVGDGVEPPAFADERVHSMRAPEHRSAGLTRNEALDYELALDPNGSRYIAFLDDDDELARNYVQVLRRWANETDADCIVHRMTHPEFGILPSLIAPQLEWGQVGISFAVKREHFKDGLRFIAEQDPNDPEKARNEDIELITQLKSRGATFCITPEVTYVVRGNA